jgi:hypothetical protein
VVRAGAIGLVQRFLRADAAPVWGFKEIRFGSENPERFTKKME